MKLYYMFLNKNEEIIPLPARREGGLLPIIANRASISLTALVEFLNESIFDTEMKTELDQQLAGAKQCSAEHCLPSFISHPNEIVLHVLNQNYVFLPH